MKSRSCVAACVGSLAVLLVFAFPTTSLAGAGPCRAEGGLHWIHFDDAEDDEVVGAGFWNVGAVGVCAGVLGTEVNAGIDIDNGYGPSYFIVQAGVNCTGSCTTTPPTGGGFGKPGCHTGVTVAGIDQCLLTQTRNTEVSPNPPEVDTGFNLIVPVVNTPIALCVTVGGNCTN